MAKRENELIARMRADIARLQAMLDYATAVQTTEAEAEKPKRGRPKRKPGMPATVEE